MVDGVESREAKRTGPWFPEPVPVGDVWCSRCPPQQLIQLVDALVRDPQARPRSITFLNAHVYGLAQDGDEELRAQLRGAAVVAVDGVSMSLASWVLNGEWLPRCMMTSAFDGYVMSATVAAARAILVGASEAEVEKAAAAVNERSPRLRVVATCSGYRPLGDYAGILAGAGPLDLVLLGMGSPRSEGVMRVAQEQCPHAVTWHIGAGTLKCYAGTKRRAPHWIQTCGLEWLHRLVREPHTRRRYLIGLPRFVWRLSRTWVRERTPARFAAPSSRSQDAPTHRPHGA